VTANLLHQGVSMTCPHGGTASVAAPVNSRVKVGGQVVLVAADVATVAGCSFNVSGAPSPCVRIEWQQPAQRVTVGGEAALLSTSVASCVNAAGGTQGTATIAGAQTRVSAR
jgi:hypothetical protein